MPHHALNQRYSRAATLLLAKWSVSSLSNLWKLTEWSVRLTGWPKEATGGRDRQMRLTVRSHASVKVHLVSRDVLTIAGLRQLLKPCSFISITGVSSDDETTIAAITASSPDILVVSSTKEEDIDALVTLARAVNQLLKVVVLTDETVLPHLVTKSPSRFEAVLVQGGDHLEDIGAVLRIVHRGGRVISAHYPLGDSAFGGKPVDERLTSRLLGLSARETLILRELAKGRTNAQIAQLLHVSVATIKADLARIMEIMQSSSRVDLAVQAAQCGLISEDI
ncbi:hypothetical protein GM708_01230 [Vibrio cholerae]|nr:hypothetical protein [Vibrio cholerae]